MSRRNWIKIYPEGFLRRTLFKELLPIERWVWIGFLCLAGDNAFDGKVCVAEDMGYTDEQLAKLLDIDIDNLKIAKKKMIKFEKISVDKNNVIQIVSWDIYQSEYQRQRDYRQEKLQRKVTTQSYNAKLHVDRDIDIDKDIKIEKENKSSIPLKEIVELYNSTCTNLPKVQELTDKRKQAIRLRWNKYATRKDKQGVELGMRVFEELFTKANDSDLLSGRIPDNRGFKKQWRADFDWLLKEDKFIKTLEGGYDN